jgi:5-methylcytosine-specific restriction endonuclease McrA
MDTVPHHALDGNLPQKQCTGPCQRVLPATPEYFTRHRKSKDGLYNHCKQCKSAKAKAYYAAHLEEERAQSRQRYATHREEERARHKQYYAAHREEERALHKQYYAAHQEEVRAYKRQYYADHKEQVSEYEKRYRKDHQEQASRRYRKYREAHTEELAAKQRIYSASHLSARLLSIKKYNQTERGILVQRAGSHNRRARKWNAPGSHTTEELQQQLKRQKGKCYYCHVKLGKGRNSWHADHLVPLSRGGSNDIHNLVIACPQCNCKKHDKLPHEWAEGGRLLEEVLPYRPLSGASPARGVGSLY